MYLIWQGPESNLQNNEINMRLILIAYLNKASAYGQTHKILYRLLARTMQGRMIGHAILKTYADVLISYI